MSDDSWRDRPATLGDLHDALEAAATETEKHLLKMNLSYQRRRWVDQTVRLLNAVQIDFYKAVARKIKEKYDV